MRTPSPDKRERESSSSIEMTPSPGSTTTESTTSRSPHTGSTTDGSIINSSPTSKSSTTGSTVTASSSSEPRDSYPLGSDSSDSDSSDNESTTSESTMTEGRTSAQWYELREDWILHRFEEKTEFTCHQCNKEKTDILVAMKPEKNWDNMCCNACFCMKIGEDSDEWNLVTVDGIDHIW